MQNANRKRKNPNRMTSVLPENEISLSSVSGTKKGLSDNLQHFIEEYPDLSPFPAYFYLSQSLYVMPGCRLEMILCKSTLFFNLLSSG